MSWELKSPTRMTMQAPAKRTVAAAAWAAGMLPYLPRTTVRLVVPAPAVTPRISSSISTSKLPEVGRVPAAAKVRVVVPDVIPPVAMAAEP